MKVAAAYLLAKLGGNDAPTADDISKILGSGMFLFNVSTGRWPWIAFIHGPGDWRAAANHWPHYTRFWFIQWCVLCLLVVGVDSDADSAALLIKELEGKDVEEVIAEGRGKLASVPAGGAVAAGGAAGAAAAGGAAPAEEEKVEEEEDEDMGFSLFD